MKKDIILYVISVVNRQYQTFDGKRRDSKKNSAFGCGKFKGNGL